MEHWSEYTRFIITLMVILDPFMALPIFLELTRDHTQPERRRVARIATFAVVVVLFIAALSGETLLTWMGTSLGSFRVGGGIVLLLMALAMLRAESDRVRTTPNEEITAAQRTSIAVVPIAIPLMAGPGAIGTVIISMQRSTAPYHSWLILGGILAVGLLLWMILHLAEPIGRALGDIGLNILNRVLGLLLAAIAVEMMANGLKQLFPLLVGS
jgi:multiple antibiotic resistance protein